MSSGNASLGFISIFRAAGSKINDLILRNNCKNKKKEEKKPERFSYPSDVDS